MAAWCCTEKSNDCTVLFAIHLFTNGVPECSHADAGAMQDFPETFVRENQLVADRLSLDALRFYNYKEQMDMLIKEMPVASFQHSGGGEQCPC